MAAQNRKVQLIEEDLERSEERSNTALTKLAEASEAAEEAKRSNTALTKLAEASEAAEEAKRPCLNSSDDVLDPVPRMCKVLENRSQQDEERMDQLTNQLKEARLLAEDADGKSDEVSRKLAFVEDELEVAEDRVKSGDSKIMELEEELKVVGNSLKSLEVSEVEGTFFFLFWPKFQANQRVEEYKRQIKTLTVKLKEAEARAEFAEKSVKKLQKEVDRLEDLLFSDKEKYKAITDDLDQTFAELTGY
uniref:Tropomyosin n=1 Tax=Timema cristinae TaxID=61476 RepID=A0A7R9HBS0_TIMCR|nr:unnamed protein product [Timema cristinae]